MNATYSKNAMDIFAKNSNTWGIGVKDLARVLNVTRQRVEEWLNSKEIVFIPRATNQSYRMLDIDSLLGYFWKNAELRMYYYDLAQWIFAEHMRKEEGSWTK